MGVQIVFSGTTNPTSPNLSERFKDAVGFFISAPLISDEVEIDVFLQLYLPLNRVRNIPLGKITEQAVLLNLTDSESISVIPEEFQDTDLEMALLFLPSESFVLQAFIITKEITLSGLSEQLIEINRRLNEIPTNTDFTDIIDTIVDVAFIANLTLPLIGLPSLPVLPGYIPTLPLLPGLP